MWRNFRICGSFFAVSLLDHPDDVSGMEDKTHADGKVCGFGTIDCRTVAASEDFATLFPVNGGRASCEPLGNRERLSPGSSAQPTRERMAKAKPLMKTAAARSYIA